jgi:hypothetical protein
VAPRFSRWQEYEELYLTGKLWENSLRLNPTDIWNELEVKDGASTVGFQMIIHLQSFYTLGIGEYILKQSNFHNGIDSTPNNHIYFKIWDSNISNYAYYGSVENQGKVNNIRHSNGIISGNFSGKFVRHDNPNEFININDGRFDINTLTLPNHPFP